MKLARNLAFFGLVLGAASVQSLAAIAATLKSVDCPQADQLVYDNAVLDAQIYARCIDDGDGSIGVSLLVKTHLTTSIGPYCDSVGTAKQAYIVIGDENDEESNQRYKFPNLTYLIKEPNPGAPVITLDFGHGLVRQQSIIEILNRAKSCNTGDSGLGGGKG